MTPFPDSWYDDYAAENRYSMQSFTDYCNERQANGGRSLKTHSISTAVV